MCLDEVSCCWKNRAEEGEDAGGGVERGMKIAKWIEGRQEKTSRREFVVKDGIGLGLREKKGILMAGREKEKWYINMGERLSGQIHTLAMGVYSMLCTMILDISVKDGFVKSMACV